MHILTRMNFMLDFICIGPFELRGTRNKRQLKNKNSMFGGIVSGHSSCEEHGTSDNSKTKIPCSVGFEPMFCTRYI